MSYFAGSHVSQAMQATVAQHGGEPSLPPILVTVVAGADDISMRISDQGQRIRLYISVGAELRVVQAGAW